MEITNLKTNKVVCIDDDFTSQGDDKRLDAIIHHFEQLPNKGEIYTIRLIIKSPYGTGLLLEELSNPIIEEPPFNGIEPNFNINRFKPLVEESVEVEEVEEIEN